MLGACECPQRIVRRGGGGTNHEEKCIVYSGGKFIYFQPVGMILLVQTYDAIIFTEAGFLSLPLPGCLVSLHTMEKT